MIIKKIKFTSLENSEASNILLVLLEGNEFDVLS
jgi:hypothetical protein